MSSKIWIRRCGSTEPALVSRCATPAPAPAFAPNALVESLYDAKGSQSRVAVFKIPNSPLGLEFVEFKGISQTPVDRGLQEPGANLLVIPVADVGATMATG